MNTDESSYPPRYAFIDVQNTISTTTQLLGFTIDWQKLYRYLKDHWKCEKVFFYSGIRQGDEERVKEFQDLAALGYEVRSKFYSVYKNRDRKILVSCPHCLQTHEYKIDRGVRWKSNCDVELTTDVLNHAAEGAEHLIFTGDGDFSYVMKDIIKKGVKVYIVSSAIKIERAQGDFISRFSKDLRILIAEEGGKIKFIDINSWKIKVKK